jgi:hypothetical protein
MAPRPARPGAAQQAQQEGFGLVVLRVPEGDHRGAALRARLVETTRSARCARRLRASAASRRASAADVAAAREERHAQRLRQPLHEPLVVVRRGAQLVVEVHEPRELQIAGASSSRRMWRARPSPIRRHRGQTRVPARSDRAADELADA